MTPIPLGLCQCGCGGKTSVPVRDWVKRGHFKGIPVRYIKGHSRIRQPNTVEILGGEAWLLLDNGKRSRISLSDVPMILQYRWSIDSLGYVDSSKGRLHAVLMGRAPRHHVDHINRDKLDNRRENLRLVPAVVNVRNHSNSTRNTSGHNGVSWVKCEHKVKGQTYQRWTDGDGRWRAFIVVNNRQVFLGYFRSFEDAVAARVAGERLHWNDTRALMVQS